MKKSLIFAALCLAAGCAPDPAPSQVMDAEMSIVVSDAAVRPLLPGKTVTAGYFKLSNAGQVDDALISASSDIAETVELHTHLNEDGVMRMRRVERVALPAGGEVVFKPGGYHLMLFGVTEDSALSRASITLNFENADPVTIEADIAVPNMQINHGGHE